MCIFQFMVLEVLFFPLKLTQHAIYSTLHRATFSVYYKKCFFLRSIPVTLVFMRILAKK